MKVPLSWLTKYVPVSILPKELARRLTMAGIEVGRVEEIGSDWDREKIVVGRVLKVDKHPNADKLTLPTVELGGGETATVVCGAPNIAAGQTVVFAREGAMLFSPRSRRMEQLKAATIRGVVSAGMVCSDLELGLGEDHEGIVVLDADAPMGTPLADYLGDVILDVEITPNRPDCLSVLGVAHEVAALTGEAVEEPDLGYPETDEPIGDQAKIEISDPGLCARYTASLISGVEIGPSPRWMQDTLSKAGQRPINNVVDVTNYVMLEFGQPLHAFDFDVVKERTITVRAARPDEELITLDGQTRKLRPPMLTIADAHDAIGLAGVMGGANSEMHEGTTSVLLESASFDAVNSRRTASALKLSTEASYRFERGIRAELAPLALRRATQLILEVAGGKAAKGFVDLYPGRKEPPVVKISKRRVKQVLGVDLSIEKVEKVLSSLGFERSQEPDAAPERKCESAVWMKVPYWRSDIVIEDDLVEEVARIAGYDSIPTTMLSAPVPHHEAQPARLLRERIRDTLAASGLQEVISYSLSSLETLRKSEALDQDARPLSIANPLSSEHTYLRTTLRGSILDTLAANRRTNHHEGIRLFEIGRVYIPGLSAERGLPHEREMVVAVFSGPRFPISWLVPQNDMDFFDAKGVVEAMFGTLDSPVSFESGSDPVLQQGRTALLVCDGTEVGRVGEVDPRVAERFDVGDRPVAMFEIDLEALVRAVSGGTGHYRTASRFPESERDLGIIVDEGTSSRRVQQIIERHELVVSSQPFDVYAGQEVPSRKKSVAYRVVFQSPVTTLTADQVNRAQEEILGQLRRELGAELRG